MGNSAGYGSGYASQYSSKKKEPSFETKKACLNFYDKTGGYTKEPYSQGSQEHLAAVDGNGNHIKEYLKDGEENISSLGSHRVNELYKNIVEKGLNRNTGMGYY